MGGKESPISGNVELDVNRLLDQGAALITKARADIAKNHIVGSMELPKGVEPGKAKITKVSKEQTAEFQSLNDDIMEYFGLQEKSGYDIKFWLGVQYLLVEYENLPQAYIEELKTTAAVRVNTVAAAGYSMSVKVEPSISLRRNIDTPIGEVRFEFTIDTMRRHEVGEAIFAIKGKDMKPSVRWLK